MTRFKKISLYFALLTMFQLTNCTENQVDDSEKYPQRSTEFLEYEVVEDTNPAPEGAQPHGPKVISDVKIISDEKFNNYTSFGFGLERKKVTAEVENGKIIIKTETWTRKKLDDSWLPAKIAVGVGALTGTGIAYSQRKHLQTALKNYLGLGNQSQKTEQKAESEAEQTLAEQEAAFGVEQEVETKELPMDQLIRDKFNISLDRLYSIKSLNWSSGDHAGKLYDEIQERLEGKYKFSKDQFRGIYSLMERSDGLSGLEYIGKDDRAIRFREYLKKYLTQIYPNEQDEIKKLSTNHLPDTNLLFRKARSVLREAGFRYTLSGLNLD